jgi:hypothetical protein
MINHGFWGIPIVELPCLHIPWHQRFSGLPWQAWLWQLYRWHQAIWVLFHWDETEIRMRWIPSGSLIYLDVSIILDVHWAKHMNFGKDAILCYLSLVLSYPGPHQEAWYHVAAWGLATTCDMGKEHGDPVVLSSQRLCIQFLDFGKIAWFGDGSGMFGTRSLHHLHLSPTTPFDSICQFAW